MLCIISNVTDLIRNHMEKTNRMQCVLGVTPTFVLTDYQEKRRDRVDWYSPPYHTHSHGYKMCVNVDLSRSKEELCVYSCLLPGEYDDGLKWPFRWMVVLQLLNQLSDDNHYDYVFDYSQAHCEFQRARTGCRYHLSPSTNCLPLTALEYNSSKKCQYLKNDCLKFKIVVKSVATRKYYHQFFSS